MKKVSIEVLEETEKEIVKDINDLIAQRRLIRSEINKQQQETQK